VSVSLTLCCVSSINLYACRLQILFIYQFSLCHKTLCLTNFLTYLFIYICIDFFLLISLFSSVEARRSHICQQYGRFADDIMETVRLCGQLHHRVQQHENIAIHLYGRCRRWRLYGVGNGDRVGDTWRPLLPDGRSCQWTSTEPTEWHSVQLYR